MKSPFTSNSFTPVSKFLAATVEAVQPPEFVWEIVAGDAGATVIRSPAVSQINSITPTTGGGIVEV